MNSDDTTTDIRARRRAVRVAVERRPGITVDELVLSLAKLGVAATAAEIESDALALGLTVDRRRPGRTRIVPPGDEPGAVSAQPSWAAFSAQREADPPAGDPGDHARDASPDGPDADDDERLAGPDDGEAPVLVAGRPVLLAVLAGAVLLVALVAVSTRSGEPSNEPDAVVAASVVRTTVTTTAAPTTTAPLPPGDPELAFGADGVDAFDRPDQLGLGTGEAGEWETASGAWSIQDGRALAAGTLGDPDAAPSIALVGPEAQDVRAEVHLPGRVANAGIVFRAASAEDFWMFVIVPQLATFGLVRYVDGEWTVVGSTEPISTGGVARVGVHAFGGTVEVLVNGVVARTFTDVRITDGRRVGIGVLGDAAPAAFDEFRFRVED